MQFPLAKAWMVFGNLVVHETAPLVENEVTTPSRRDPLRDVPETKRLPLAKSQLRVAPLPLLRRTLVSAPFDCEIVRITPSTFPATARPARVSALLPTTVIVLAELTTTLLKEVFLLPKVNEFTEPFDLKR
jgi:hypothetical protein